MSLSKRIQGFFIDYEISLKHLRGQHNQKRHGWRYGNMDSIKRAMRAGVSDDFDKTTPVAERDAYRSNVAKRGDYPSGWAGKLDRSPKPKPTVIEKKGDDFNSVQLPLYYKDVDHSELTRQQRNSIGVLIGKRSDSKDVDVFIASAEMQAKRILARSQMAKRAYALDALRILREGRFKSQFETGTSNGAYSPRARQDAEKRGLGVPVNISKTRRPIYGYARGAKGKDNHEASQYGDVIFIFKDSVRKKTTFTFDDSLGGFGGGNLAGSPVNSPKITSLKEWNIKSVFTPSGKIKRENTSYWEIQIHDKVTVNDVAKVIFTQRSKGRTPPEVFEKLNELGIPFEYED